MIKNSLKYIKNYFCLSDKIKLGLEFLQNNDLKAFKNGKYLIQGDDVYANIQDYNSKPIEQGKWEAHRKYIDIQYIIDGEELIGVGEIQNFKTIESYDEEKDVEFLSANCENMFVQMNEDDFVILYPFDVHMPQIAINNSKYVKKAVVKVSV